MNNPRNSGFQTVTIFILATDETETLKKTVDTIVSVCNASDIEQIEICYPDFVTPTCLETANQLAESYSYIPVRPFKQTRKGIGGAVQEGIENTKSTHFFMLDAHGSRDLETVARLIENAKANPEKICKTSRMLRKNSYHGYGRAKLAVNYLAQLFLKTLYGPKCTDMLDAFQMAPTCIYQAIRWEETGYPFYMELVLKPLRLGCGYIEVPSNCYGRSEGKSGNTAKQKLGYLRVAFKVRFTPRTKLLKEPAQKDCL